MGRWRGRVSRVSNYGGSTGFDKNLQPRIEGLIKDLENDILLRDVDGLVEMLRNNHPEYRRKPLQPFTKVVGRVAKAILDKQTLGSSDEDDSGDSNDDQGPDLPTDEASNAQEAPQNNPNPATTNESTRETDTNRKRHLSPDTNTPGGVSANHNNTNNTSSFPSTSTISTTNKNDQTKRTRVGEVSAQSSGVGDYDAFARRGGGKFFGRKEKSDKDDQGFVAERPLTRFSDVGGMDVIIQDVREVIEFPLRHPEIFAHLGVDPPRGVLLHGPPGCGKTLLANAIAGELGVNFFRLSAPEIVSGMSGESEKKIRALFQQACQSAPALVFIDEIDAIATKRENAQREMERRIVAQLLSCMDRLSSDLGPEKAVVILAASNRPDAIDEALRRAGRFEREICLHAPDMNARRHILQVMCSKLRVSGEVDFPSLARRTGGYVGADLEALTREAASAAIRRIFHNMLISSSSSLLPASPSAGHTEGPAVSSAVVVSDVGSTSVVVQQTEMFVVPPIVGDNDVAMECTSQGNNVVVENQVKTGGGNVKAGVANEIAHTTLDARTRISDAISLRTTPLTPEELESLTICALDFELALKTVQPSATREGFTTVPGVTWRDIGALDALKAELELAVVEPIKKPELFESMGLKPSVGVLMYGPPGCGKTMLAKAVANASGANFISVKGPELLDKFVGESERAVRRVFQRGRASAPCVIFFDELDSLTPKRGSDSGSGSASERVVNQLLTEMDGLDGRGQVFVIAATNRPDIIDPAMLRPGRLDKLLYVPLPTPSDREQILHTACQSLPISGDVQIHVIAHDTRANGFSGADLSSLVREAAVGSIREQLNSPKQTQPFSPPLVTAAHFEAAFDKVFPSVSKKDEQLYLKLQKSIRKVRLKEQAQPGNSGENENDPKTEQEKGTTE